jgi:DNA repair protein RadD
MALRQYQVGAVEEGVAFLNSKPAGSKYKDKGVIVAPTAAGKSHIIAAIAKSKASIYSASVGVKQIGEVTFATIGSIKDKGHLFEGCKIIIDECHMFPPKDDSMLGKFMAASKTKKILGLTATPFRLYGDELKFITRTNPKLFGSIVHIIQVQEITGLGYWSKLLYKAVKFDSGMLQLNSAGSEYTDESMKKAFKANDMEGTILHTVSKMLNPGDPKFKARRSILVFVPSVDEARRIAGKIPGAVAVWGDMPKDDRDDYIEGFRNGDIKVVVNVNVLAVGFDYPGIDGIIVARPTMSLAWYYQAIGRGTRVDPTGYKKDCWVYDLAGTFDRFGRVENIIITDLPDYGWGVFGTEQKRLFTNVSMSEQYCFTMENVHQMKLFKKAMSMGWGWPLDPKKRFRHRFDPATGNWKQVDTWAIK